jgi:hypothetical protein
MVVDRYAGELGMGQSVGGGGARSRVVMGISPMSDPEQNREVGWTHGTLGRLLREDKKRRGLWRQRILTEGCGSCSAGNEGDDLILSDWVLLVTFRERVEECRGAGRALGSLNREGEAVSRLPEEAMVAAAITAPENWLWAAARVSEVGRRSVGSW